MSKPIIRNYEFAIPKRLGNILSSKRFTVYIAESKNYHRSDEGFHLPERVEITRIENTNISLDKFEFTLGKWYARINVEGYECPLLGEKIDMTWSLNDPTRMLKWLSRGAKLFGYPIIKKYEEGENQ